MGSPFAKVLVAVDAAAASERALDAAAELCATTGAELHLVHVKIVQPSVRAVRGRLMTPSQRAIAEGEAEQLFGRMRERVEGRGGTVAGTHVRFSEGIERALVRAQEELDADLLVIPGRPGGRLSERLRSGGSPVAPSGVIKRAGRSVLVVGMATDR